MRVTLILVFFLHGFALGLDLASAAAASPEIDDLVAALASDDKPQNARLALANLHRQAWHDDVVARRLRTLLEPALSDPDRQLRQAATWLLGSIYERYGVAENEWPQVFLDQLVDGLRDDDVRGHRLVANAARSAELLYRLEARRPVAALAAYLRGDDAQARFAAAVILARYGAGEVESLMHQILLHHLEDNGKALDEVAAYRALIDLGEASLRRLLADASPREAQQAAFLQCAAATFGLAWEAPQRHVEAWFERADQQRSRPAIAALYLHPRAAVLAADHQVPGLLQRLHRLGPRSGGAAARAHWAADWFLFLRAEAADSALRFAIVSGS